MSKRRYVYATSMGALFRFTPRDWKAMLRRAAKGDEVLFDDFGDLLIGYVGNITDLDVEEAKDRLSEEEER